MPDPSSSDSLFGVNGVGPRSKQPPKERSKASTLLQERSLAQPFSCLTLYFDPNLRRPPPNPKECNHRTSRSTATESCQALRTVMLSRSLFWEFASSHSVLTVSQGLQEGARRVLQAPSSCSIQGRAFQGSLRNPGLRDRSLGFSPKDSGSACNPSVLQPEDGRPHPEDSCAPRF